MKFVKGISLFFIYPMFMLVLGFYAGVRLPDSVWGGSSGPEGTALEPLPDEFAELPGVSTGDARAEDETTPYLEAAVIPETLSIETEYVLEEKDVYGDTVVETTGRLPAKYVGMNREQFIEAMEEYEAFPPLSERQRGFVGLEVRSFSRARVVVQMNYQFVLPTSSFYLAAFDNEVVVLLEDRETIYIETNIRLEKLPEEQQQEIINMMWIENEEALYDFLEAHSS